MQEKTVDRDSTRNMNIICIQVQVLEFRSHTKTWSGIREPYHYLPESSVRQFCPPRVSRSVQHNFLLIRHTLNPQHHGPNNTIDSRNSVAEQIGGGFGCSQSVSLQGSSSIQMGWADGRYFQHGHVYSLAPLFSLAYKMRKMSLTIMNNVVEPKAWCKW